MEMESRRYQMPGYAAQGQTMRHGKTSGGPKMLRTGCFCMRKYGLLVCAHGTEAAMLPVLLRRNKPERPSMQYKP